MEHHIIKSIDDFKKLQEYVASNDWSTPTIKLINSGYNIQFIQDEDFFLPMNIHTPDINKTMYNWVQSLKTINKDKDLIFGKDNTKNIVSCEVNDSHIELFIEENNQVTSKFIPNKFWLVSDRQFDSSWSSLSGDLPYKYIKYYDEKSKFYGDKNRYKDNVFGISDSKESAMVLNGFTYFKGMKVKDVSILCSDIEATTLEHNDKAQVLMISNILRKNETIVKKIFSIDQYETQAEMLDAWCLWVREVNPSIIGFYNGFAYDFPYLNFVARKSGTTLALGRDGSDIRFDSYESKFRKDGSQDYNYKRCHIYGREIIDLMFVAYHFDIARKYESYGLKNIVKQEGLAREGRQYYEAQHIGEDWKDSVKRELIKTYGQDDADETLAIYDLMIPSYFYFSRSVPKSFQALNYSASGSQLNSILIRGYLQEGHSLPKGSEAEPFEGAISDGFPGIYKNVFKVDVASLYPSIMLQYEIYDKYKDPKKNFLKMVQFFTNERLENKKKGKETGDRYFKELEQSQKIGINSSYGLLGAKGLLFNSPSNGELVTKYGRDILKKAVLWATGQEYIEKKDQEEDEDA